MTAARAKELVAGALSSLRGLANLDPSVLSEDELMRAAGCMERARSTLEIGSAHMAVDLDLRGSTLANHGLRTDQFLANSPSQDRQDCRIRIRTAKGLRRDFPLIDEAIVQGRLSWSHGVTLVSVSNRRIVADLIELQEPLIELAQHLVFDRWRNELRGLCQLLDSDGGHDPNRDLESNKLNLTHEGSSTLVKGELLGEHAVVATEAIEQVADELFAKFSADRDASPDVSIPKRNTLRALALVEICRRANAVDTNKASPPSTQATIVIRSENTEVSHTERGHQHSSDTIAGLHCDAHVQPIVVDSDGNPVNLGRNRRLASPSQRRAVFVRDGGCVFPGCDSPQSWCVLHHVTAWHKGGCTDMGNLASLCPHHHGITHSNGWSMSAEPDQTFTWQTPRQRRLRSQRHGRAVDPPDTRTA